MGKSAPEFSYNLHSRYRDMLLCLGEFKRQEVKQLLEEFVRKPYAEVDKVNIMRCIRKSMEKSKNSLALEVVGNLEFTMVAEALIDNWWSYMNALHFDVVDINVGSKSKDYERLMDLKRDLIITFKVEGVSYCVTILKREDSDREWVKGIRIEKATAVSIYSDRNLEPEDYILRNNSLEEVLKILVKFEEEQLKKVLGDVDYSAFFVNNVNSIYINREDIGKTLCKPKICGFLSKGKEIFGCECCYMTERKKEHCTCYKNSVTIEKIKDIALYCLEQYGAQTNRIEFVEEGYRGNSGDAKVGDKGKIENKKEIPFSYGRIPSIIRVHKRSISRGGHHNSPVEHERRGHLRHYKNGKVVEVKGSVINKGSERKRIYKV
jgi:hypothetical protein